MYSARDLMGWTADNMPFTLYAVERAKRHGHLADVCLMEGGFTEGEADRLLNAAANKGYIEYGVSPRAGWLTDEGRAFLDAHIYQMTDAQTRIAARAAIDPAYRRMLMDDARLASKLEA
jgi:hypothetical protein